MMSLSNQNNYCDHPGNQADTKTYLQWHLPHGKKETCKVCNKFGDHTEAEFIAAIERFVCGCNVIVDHHMATSFPKNHHNRGKSITYQMNKVRARLFSDIHSVHSFVDFKTGDIFMAATYDTPAKHSRGNIYDEFGGLGKMYPYGPAYLDGRNIGTPGLPDGMTLLSLPVGPGGSVAGSRVSQ